MFDEKKKLILHNMQVCSMFDNNSCRCLDNDVKGPILELKGGGGAKT